MACEKKNLRNVDNPEDQSSNGNGAKETGNSSAASSGGSRSRDSDVPDGEDKGDKTDRVPTPLLSSVGVANSRESTGKNEDDIGDNGHDGVGTINTSQQAQLENENRRGERPVDIASPEDLATDVVVGVGDVLVVVSHAGAVVVRGLARCHGEVGQGGDDCGEGAQEVEHAALHSDVP